MAGWWARLFGRAEARAVSYQDFWGSGADLPSISAGNISTALTLAPVYAATRLLADAVASLPIHVFRRASGGTRRRAPLPPLLRDPTEFGTPVEWVQRAMTSLLLRGNAFGLVTLFDVDGWPLRVEWLHPDEVVPSDDRTTARPQWYWQGRPVPFERIVHIPGYVLPGRVLGVSPITAYALTTETGLLSQQFGRDWFRNGSVPSAVLETDQMVDQAQAAAIKERFRLAAAGREPVALGAGVKYHAITVSPNESQFLETLKMTTSQIAAIYGIPPEMIGGETGNSLTYATVEQQALNFATYTLRPHLTKLEAAFSALMPESHYMKFNVDAIIRADLKTRYEAHHIALTDGWKSRDEVRALEDLPPLPDGQGATYADPSQQHAPPSPNLAPDAPVRRLRAAGEQE